MNDAATASSSRPLSWNETQSPASNHRYPSAESSYDLLSAETRNKLRKEKRAAFLDDLLLNLDILIYLQLSVLYYMDASLTFLLLRLLPQWFYLTPKSSVLPPAPATWKPYLLWFCAGNFLCCCLHLLNGAPAAGEASRFYLHGGVLIDFVGQLSPVSTFKLVVTDFLLWALEMFMLAVLSERRKLEVGRTIAAQGTRPDADDNRATTQDHDAEERGQLGRRNLSSADEIEMQPLRESLSAENRSAGDELQTLAREAEHPLDTFYTGQNVIVSLAIAHILRSEWSNLNHQAESRQPANAQQSPAVAAAVAAGRSLGFRLQLRNQAIRDG